MNQMQRLSVTSLIQSSRLPKLKKKQILTTKRFSNNTLKPLKTETRIDSDIVAMKYISVELKNLQARPMRDNLVFTGIKEDDGEDTEEVL